ncbi:hypothetical protein E2C01_098519 [Portunus trituberculatus]|uniref:Uncharacterized protein n=1 Tax=Portunus trituberculatus TaxID=210409 RepID=A0A5B7K772_PORTR|nr:hypothetical protein [Portunus trituberculatus]
MVTSLDWEAELSRVATFPLAGGQSPTHAREQGTPAAANERVWLALWAGEDGNVGRGAAIRSGGNRRTWRARLRQSLGTGVVARRSGVSRSPPRSATNPHRAHTHPPPVHPGAALASQVTESVAGVSGVGVDVQCAGHGGLLVEEEERCVAATDMVLDWTDPTPPPPPPHHHHNHHPHHLTAATTTTATAAMASHLQYSEDQVSSWA